MTEDGLSCWIGFNGLEDEKEKQMVFAYVTKKFSNSAFLANRIAYCIVLTLLFFYFLGFEHRDLSSKH